MSYLDFLPQEIKTIIVSYYKVSIPSITTIIHTLSIFGIINSRDIKIVLKFKFPDL